VKILLPTWVFITADNNVLYTCEIYYTSTQKYDENTRGGGNSDPSNPISNHA